MRQPIINIGARHGEKHSPVSGRAQFATIPRHLRHGSATPAGPVHNAPAPRLRCPKCGHKHCSALQSRKLYQCRHRFQVSLTQGTIFASIKLLLPIWMLAIYLLTQSTPRAASSFSLNLLPWSTGNRGCPPVFISSATPRSTGYIALPEFSPGPFVRQAVRLPAVACCFAWQFPHSVFCAGH